LGIEDAGLGGVGTGFAGEVEIVQNFS